MASVTINGNSYSDDGTAGRDMRNGGHRQWLLPMLNDLMVETKKVAEVVAGGLVKLTLGPGAYVDSTSAGLHVRGTANDGTQGITIDNNAPTLALVDRSAGAYGFRWKADGSFLRLEPDNADAGASWQAYRALFGDKGQLTLGGGGGNSAIQLYVRGSDLVGAVQYGTSILQTFSASAVTSGTSLLVTAAVADAVFTMPTLTGVLVQPSVGAQATVTNFAGLQVNNSNLSNIGTIHAVRLRQTAGAGRWNLYIDGSAINFLAGRVGIGVDAPTTKLHVVAESNLTSDYAALVSNAGGTLAVGLGAYGLSNKLGISQSSDFTIQLGGNLVVQSGELKSTGTVQSDVGFKVAAIQVVGTRKTGWSAMTGTAARTAAATHTAQTIGASYTQAQVQALDDDLVKVSQRLKGLIDDLISHGLIGA